MTISSLWAGRMIRRGGSTYALPAASVRSNLDRQADGLTGWRVSQAFD
jgi:hypothetical protein